MRHPPSRKYRCHNQIATVDVLVCGDGRPTMQRSRLVARQIRIIGRLAGQRIVKRRRIPKATWPVRARGEESAGLASSASFLGGETGQLGARLRAIQGLVLLLCQGQRSGDGNRVDKQGA